MGKIKSALCLILITLVIAALCVVCFVPFPTGSDKIHYYNPIINWTDKGADLGGNLLSGDTTSYVGGDFSIMLYPEGVISEKEYTDNLEMLEGEDLKEFEEQYVSHANGRLWLEKEVVMDGEEVSTEFKETFAKRLEILQARYERLHAEGMTMQIVDDYAIRVTLPEALDASIASFVYYAYVGNLEVSYGSSLTSAKKLLPEEGKKAKPISDYISGAGTRTINGTPYVAIHFTAKGRDIVKSATADAESSSGTLYFTVGGDQVIGLTVSSQLTEKDLYISGNYSSDAATIMATVIDTAIEYDSGDLDLGRIEVGELHQNPARFGDNALLFIYIAAGAALLASAVFFIIRYGRLGFAHIYTLLIYLLSMLICIWAIPTLYLGMNTVAAFLLAATLLSVCDAIAFESARKEYALGKTVSSSIKTGYKKCFWHVFDMHIAVLIVGLLLFLIGLTELSAFGLVLTLGALISGIASLAINRFMWFITMPFAKNAAKFCHFKREEVEDDD